MAQSRQQNGSRGGARQTRSDAAGAAARPGRPELGSAEQLTLRLQGLVGNQAVARVLAPRLPGADAGAPRVEAVGPVGPVGRRVSGVGGLSRIATARTGGDGGQWAPKRPATAGAVARPAAGGGPAAGPPGGAAVQRDTKLVEYKGAVFREALGGAWGMTDTEQIIPKIAAEQREPGKRANPATGALAVAPLWAPKVGSLTGQYSLRAGLIAGAAEVKGPGTDTTKANWKHQVSNLNSLGDGAAPYMAVNWYMVRAVRAHELVHKDSVGTALEETEAPISRAIEAALPTVRAATPTAARAAFVASPAYTKANDAARLTWDAKYVSKIGSDHTGRTPTAEHKIVDPMIRKIRSAFDPTFKGRT